MDVRLTDKATGVRIGAISRADFQFLVDSLEEESSRDTDYFIDSATISILEDAGASPSLLAVLRQAVGSSDGVDIAWEDG